MAPSRDLISFQREAASGKAVAEVSSDVHRIMNLRLFERRGLVFAQQEGALDAFGGKVV